MRKKILASAIAGLIAVSMSITAYAATAQDIINKNQGSYTAGTQSVYGPNLTQDQLNAIAQATADFKNNYITDNMDNDTKIKTAHDFLKNHVSYIDWDKGEGANTAYGALVKGQAACSGYARAFKVLCDSVDVSCYYIHADATAGNPSHQWNMAEYNDGFYFIDVEANDSSGFNAIYHSSSHPYTCDMSQFPAIGSKSGANISGTQTVNSGWIEENGTWFYYENGNKAVNKWIGGTYYVGSDGAMLTNTTTPDGYSVGADGAWIQETQNIQDTTPQTTGTTNINYVTDSSGLDTNQAAGWFNDNGKWAYRKEDGEYFRLEWARIDGKDYYFDIEAHMEWELEPLSTRNRPVKSIINKLENERARGIQPGENWQSDTHGVWYKKSAGSTANFFAWQSNVLAGEKDFGFSPHYIKLEGKNQANLFFIRDLAACFGVETAEYLKEHEPLRYAGPGGDTVFSIYPSGSVHLNHGDDTYSIGGREMIPQLYWDAVAQGEIPEEFQFIH